MNILTPHQQQRGFSLIESLVSFLILSVGMLGIASLQTLSLKSGSTAMFRTAAVMKVDEVIENMRANQTEIAGYEVDTASPGVDHGCRQSTASNANICTTAQLAADDIHHWKDSLKTVLPNNDSTTASIDVEPPVGAGVLSTVTIQVNWNERATDNKGAVAMNFSITLQI